MKQLTLLALVALAFSVNGNAQNKKKQDQKAIKDMCGCYEIKFKYAETFSPDTTYEKAYDYRASALEWAELIADEDDKKLYHRLFALDDNASNKEVRAIINKFLN